MTLQALVDYAGLFPPAQLDVPSAMREYLDARDGRYAWMLGRFIARQSQLSRVLAAVPVGGRVRLSVILDGGVADVEWAAGFRRDTRAGSIEVLEIALAPGEVDAFAQARAERGLSDVPAFVETAAGSMNALAAHGLGAKIRCGGVTPEAYPSCQTVARFIQAAFSERVPFKATAGLHHPVRHYNEAAGLKMHGFLNLLAAAALARTGASEEELAAAIACEDASAFGLDGETFRYRDRSFEGSFMQAVRTEQFVSYGSCSFAEPVDDLRAMGVLQ